ncbi:MAG: CCA tRNA nucleotidyltransferase [Rhodospirillales bacterium]
MTEPTGKIEPQPWLTAPETSAVINALTADGDEARFVGGCVRDAILKLPVKDIDIATPVKPEKIIELLERASIKAIPTGLKHGTITAITGDARFEITTLRIDVKTDGRHAKVAFTDDWLADAKRRDFVINTLSCDKDGGVYDLLGGLDDIGNKRVRFVGNAKDRIEEDVLRILRFFRFFGAYGKPPADIDALTACRLSAPRLSELSGERIQGEMFSILLGPNPADIVQLMIGERLFEHFMGQVGDVGRLRQISWLETDAIKMNSISQDPVRRLAALLDTDLDGAGAAAERLRLSNSQTARLMLMTSPPSKLNPETDDRKQRRLLHRLGDEAVRDMALLEWASERALTPRQPRHRTEAWVELLEAAETWTPIKFPLKGGDIISLGVPQGAGVGDMLKRVEEWWEDGDFKAGRDECLEKLKKLVETTQSA